MTHSFTLGTVTTLQPRHRLFIAFLLFASLFISLDAWAGRQVLRAGREKDILALLAPYQLGAKVGAHWTLWSISIEPRRINIGLRDPSGHEEKLALVHHDDAENKTEQTKSFTLVRPKTSDQSVQEAVSSIFAETREHDDGSFWETPKEEGIIAPGEVPDTSTRRGPNLNTSRFELAFDGIATLVLIWILGILLAIRLLRESPKWMRIALPLIVLTGIVIRLLLAPPALLGAWPWSRLWSNIRTVFDGPLLHEWANRSGQTFFLTDVMMWTNFAYAAAMPLVLFSHATYLLRDPRAGLAAAFAIALLPQHIRFSRSEDAFVPSLVLTSLAFALLHAWLRDPSKIVRFLALFIMPGVLFLGYLLRPLNILFVVVYCVALALLHPETAPTKRRIMGIVVVIGVWLGAFSIFFARNQSTVENTLFDWKWLSRIVDVLLTPQLLVLTDLRVTPLVLIVLAGAGAYYAWRTGEKKLLLFLGGWWLLFVVAHAVVVNAPMQPRYHLHLVVPFLLIGAISIPHLWKNARPGLLAAAAILIASPWLHRPWIQDLHYSEMQEYEFVHEARDIIPAHCTVVEYVGPDEHAHDARFVRIGEAQAPSGRTFRYEVVPAFAAEVPKEVTKPLEKILESPPACTYLYLGLMCGRESAVSECAALRHKFVGDLVNQREIALDMYDEKTIGRLNPRTQKSVSLELWRIKSVNR